jgi:hypothetical protein
MTGWRALCLTGKDDRLVDHGSGLDVQCVQARQAHVAEPAGRVDQAPVLGRIQLAGAPVRKACRTDFRNDSRPASRATARPAETRYRDDGIEQQRGFDERGFRPSDEVDRARVTDGDCSCNSRKPVLCKPTV